MKIDFTETEIEQIKDMLDHAKDHNYFSWKFEQDSRTDREIHEAILRKLDIGE